MRTLAFVVAALVLLTGMSMAQPKITTYLIPYVQNETDTIPGTHSGGLGAGKTGWHFVGDDYVQYSIHSRDSCLVRVFVDYSDTGWASATGSSAKSVGFTTLPTATTGLVPGTLLTTFASHTAADSLVAIADVANPMAFHGNYLRSPAIDYMPGGRYIRWRVFGVNTSEKHAAAAADRVLTLRVTQWPRR